MSDPVVITDAKGRKILLRPLNVMAQVRLLRAIGPEQSANQPYVNVVQAAAGVAEIDGVPMPFPANERMIDAAIDRLGDEGFLAVAMHQKAEMEAAVAAAERAMEEGTKPDPLAQPAG